MSQEKLNELLKPLRVLAESGVLMGAKGSLRAGTLVVGDAEKALLYAGRRYEPEKVLEWPYVGWSEFRDCVEPRPVGALKSNIHKLTYKECYDAIREIQSLGIDLLTKRGWEDKTGPLLDVAEEAYEDMYDMGAYLISGDKSLFGHRLYEAYSAGGWPCGWSGEYPEGSMIVYWPYEESAFK